MSRVPTLSLDGVRFGYGERALLADVSFAVDAGRVVGLVGPNGAGKSTALRLAAGVLRPRNGAVRLDGRDLATIPRRDVARAIALVPQESTLPAGFTGRETVAMGRAPHLGWLAGPGPADRAAERRALELADARAIADRPVGALSGGERRRLLLARALAQQPRVLLLDEPAAHLDPGHALSALDRIVRLARADGLAVLAVLHDLNLASEFCDDLVALANGRVFAAGTPAEVIRSGMVRSVYGVDLPVVPHPTSGRPMVLVRARNGGPDTGSNRQGAEDRMVGGEADRDPDRGAAEAEAATREVGRPSGESGPAEPADPTGGEDATATTTGTRTATSPGRRGLVIVNTGHGKGKTSAALGVTMRAWGQGLRPIVLQFVKAKTGNWGEVRAARKMGIEVIPLGAGFTWTSKDLEKDKALARDGWERCKAAISGGEYDLVVLDELTYCFHFGWLDLDEVIETLRNRPEGQHVIVTGRAAPPELIDFADLVTEMREVKHPYKLGVKAQKGIEF